MPASIDSRFPKKDYDTMAEAVANYAETRATVAGPPRPTASFDLQGQEKQGADKLQAQLNQGPPSPAMQNMVVNGGRPYASGITAADVAGYGSKPAAPAPAAAATPAAPRITAADVAGYGSKPAAAAPAAATTPAAPRITAADLASYGAPPNPLGGMNPAPLSGRGGPMSYSRMGEDTNNPNSYRVGQNNKGSGERFLRRIARSGGEGGAFAAKTLFEAQRSDKLAPELRRDEMQKEARLTAREVQTYAMNQSDEAAKDARKWRQEQQKFDMETQRRAGESETAFQRLQQASQAKVEGSSVTGLEMMPAPDGSGYLPVAKRKNGTATMAGSYMPNKKPAPPGTTPEEWAKLVAQYPEAELEGQLPNGTKIRKGPANATEPKMVKVIDPMSGRVVDFPDGYELPEGWTALKRKGEAADPKPVIAPAAAQPQGQPVKTKSGNSYSLK